MKKLSGYTGLCPRVYQSGGTDRRGHLTHAVPKYLRWALMEAATHACRHEVPNEAPTRRTCVARLVSLPAMPSIVKLQNGDEIATDEDPQVLVDRFDESRRDGTLIKLERHEDGAIWINPHTLATIAPQHESHAPHGIGDS